MRYDYEFWFVEYIRFFNIMRGLKCQLYFFRYIYILSKSTYLFVKLMSIYSHQKLMKVKIEWHSKLDCLNHPQSLSQKSVDVQERKKKKNQSDQEEDQEKIHLKKTSQKDREEDDVNSLNQMNDIIQKARFPKVKLYIVPHFGKPLL